MAATNPVQDRKLSLDIVKVNGREFTKYYPEIAHAIILRIAEGELLVDICDPKAKVPTVARSTFLHWVATVPELAQAFRAATELSGHAFEERALKEALALVKNPGNAQRVSAVNTLIQQLRWSASRRDPTKYSDKGDTKIVVPINITSTLDLGKQAGSAGVEIPDIYQFKIEARPDVVEGEYTEVAPSPSGDEQPAPDFKALIQPEVPAVGTSRQPMLQSMSKRRGPRKEQLVPRDPNWSLSNDRKKS